MRLQPVNCQLTSLSLNLKRKHRVTSWTARSAVALFKALPADRFRQTFPCDYLHRFIVPSHPLTLALQVYALVSNFPRMTWYLPLIFGILRWTLLLNVMIGPWDLELRLSSLPTWFGARSS
jgi:hypothetical protein